MIKEFKGRDNERFDQGSELLCPSDKGNKVTRMFYSEISHLSKK